VGAYGRVGYVWGLLCKGALVRGHMSGGLSQGLFP